MLPRVLAKHVVLYSPSVQAGTLYIWDVSSVRTTNGVPARTRIALIV